MSQDKKEVKHVCVYKGPHEDNRLQPAEQAPVPPSAEYARTVALGVLGGLHGGYRTSNHWRTQMAERDFDVFDLEYAIRNGSCTEGGQYSSEHRNHKYTFRGNIDGTDFDAVFAISAEHDMISSPLLILITGCWKTKSGKRSKTY